jgi:hypothetical protein
VVAGLALVIPVVGFRILEKDLGSVLAQPVGHAGGILEERVLNGVGTGMGAGGKRGNVRVWV